MKLDWKALCVSCIIAVVLWYGVSGSEKVESLVELRVDYRGLPPGLLVRGGLVNKVEVRVKAPLGTLRALTSRETNVYYMDLASVQKGENLLDFDSARLPFRGNIEVLEVIPPRISVDVDVVASKKMILEAEIKGALPEDFTAQAIFSPAEVSLTGPSTLLEKLRKLRVPISLTGPVSLGQTESRRKLELPVGVESNPAEVVVSLHIGIKRKLVSVTRQVQLESSATASEIAIQPDKVAVKLAVPESQAGDAVLNSAIKAFVRMEHFRMGTYTLPVQVKMPEGAELVEVEPSQVDVSLGQRKPGAARQKTVEQSRKAPAQAKPKEAAQPRKVPAGKKR